MATEAGDGMACRNLTGHLPGAHGRAKCTDCAHYYITYDPLFPYGCRAMNIKSKRPPHTEVEAAAGIECQTFARRQKVPG
jgi:hypothetical protein